MDNKNSGSDRDKMLEEILSKLGTQGKDRADSGRAARAAASSANKAASDSRSYSSGLGGKESRSVSSEDNASKRSLYESNYSLKGKSSDNKYDTVKTGSVKDNNSGFYKTESIKMNQAPEKTGVLTGISDSHDKTDSKDYKSSDITSPIRNIKTANPETGSITRKGKSGKSRRTSSRLPMVLIVTTIIFTIAISLSVLIISVGRDMLAIGKSDDLKIVTIPEGANTDDVAQILYDEGIIKIPKAFIFISKLGGSDTKYIAGEHELSPSNAYETIINELTTDKSLEKETADVTFIEGSDLISAAKKLEEAGICDAERFIYYFNAGDYGFEFEKYLPASTASKFNRMEGYLFPDTYTFYVDTDPEAVCQKIYKNFNDKFKPEYYEQMKKHNMTLDEVITLASIVQAEAPDVESMKKIASVFENRLANPEEFPRLESDPTTYYVDEVIRPNIEIPSEAIFEAYDTYKSNGLPPGAIGNPGTEAIEAVLYPADTDYYFFFANIETNETFFAKTNEEHEANKDLVREQQESGNDDGEE